MDALETLNSLGHHGVMGQKWGVRRDRTPTSVNVTQKPGKRVKTSGGKFAPAHEDAKAAATAKQKARSSTVDSLSNKELQHLVNRMNLERQLSQLSGEQKSAGSKIAHAFLGDFGKRKFFEYADEAVTGNKSFGTAPRPHLKPVVDSLKVATKVQGGGKKNK